MYTYVYVKKSFAYKNKAFLNINNLNKNPIK